MFSGYGALESLPDNNSVCDSCTDSLVPCKCIKTTHTIQLRRLVFRDEATDSGGSEVIPKFYNICFVTPSS